MTVLIHRVKTDLSADEISFLQFAPIKHILKTSRFRLDDEIKSVTSRLTEHRNRVPQKPSQPISACSG